MSKRQEILLLCACAFLAALEFPRAVRQVSAGLAGPYALPSATVRVAGSFETLIEPRIESLRSWPEDDANKMLEHLAQGVALGPIARASSLELRTAGRTVATR